MVGPDVVDEPVGNRVLDGGGADELIAAVVVGPDPVLDGCPFVVDNDDPVLDMVMD